LAGLWRSTNGIKVRFTTGVAAFDFATAFTIAAATLACDFVFGSLPELALTPDFVIGFFNVFTFAFGLGGNFPAGFAFTDALDINVTFAFTLALDFCLGFALDFTTMTHILS
jgi:hypothetical protein